MKTIFCLIGFRAAGKSTIAKALGERFRVPVVDMDIVLESRIGSKIPEYIENYGELAFREKEHELLKEILSDTFRSEQMILATGGGVLDFTENIRVFEATDHIEIAYLMASPESLWERISQEPERQKVGNLNGLDAVRQLLEKRDKNYKKIARFQILNQDIRATLCELEKIVEKLWQVGPGNFD
ncbi:MAG: shikimate kinase [Oligoflexia bacterium]|nr:shikimate kinase [Oligoflexia bacterium]